MACSSFNRMIALSFAGMACAAAAAAQVQQVAHTTDDDDPFGSRNTDAGVSVNGSAVVTTSNMRVSIFDKAGVLKETHQAGDGTWPFKRVDAGTTLGPSRFFDPQTVYHPQSGRLWMVYSEENATAGSGTNNISPLHIAVSRDPALLPFGGTLDSFSTSQWWYYTGPESNPGNGGAFFNMQATMSKYPDSSVADPHEPFPSGGGVFDPSLLDKPHFAIDERAAYITMSGSIGSAMAIIPTSHGSGLSILNGDKPAPADLTFLRMSDLPEQDNSVLHWPVQEPFDPLENAQFLLSVPDGGDVRNSVRLAGLWFEESPTEPRWHYAQRVFPTGGLDDMPVDPNFEYDIDSSYRAATPDTAPPGSGFNIQTGGSFFASAVLVKINNMDWRIFAVQHVRPVAGTPKVAQDKWAIQWYVIDPDIANFRTTPSPSSDWQPTIVAMGRLDSGEGDRIHPVIMVTPQAVAYIEYTFTSAQTWPQVRRVQLNQSYTGIINNEVVRQAGPANPYFTTSSQHRRGWADFSDAQADPTNPCAFWSTHTLVHAADTTVNDRRDVWLFQTLFNCGNANLNFDESVDLLDVALFNDLFAAGARRVDMDTDGTTDATDAALFTAAYGAAQP